MPSNQISTETETGSYSIYNSANANPQAFEELERLLGQESICVAVKEKLTKDSGVAGAGAYDHIVEKLRAKPNATGKKDVRTVQDCP